MLARAVVGSAVELNYLRIQINLMWSDYPNVDIRPYVKPYMQRTRNLLPIHCDILGSGLVSLVHNSRSCLLAS